MSEKTKVQIVRINNVYGNVVTEDFTLLKSIYRQFSIPVENHWFMPKFKAGIWDGKVHFVSESGRFYNGLLPKILKYLGNDYDIEIDSAYNKEYTDALALKKEFVEYTDKTMTMLDPYVYQWRGSIKSIYHMHGICEHGTGSGKSYTISLIINFLRHKDFNHRFLILVPRLDLIEQFYEDMIQKFGFSETIIGKFCGHEKIADKSITISTWQSIYKRPKLLRTYTVLLVDEAHGLKSDEVRSVADNAINCRYRLGFTGSMPEPKSDRMLIEGVLGPVIDQALYEELNENKTISPLKIVAVKLKHNDDIVQQSKNIGYHLEKEYLYENTFRNELIIKIACKYLKEGKNGLIMVSRIEHGKLLADKLQKLGYDPDFVFGEMKIKERNEVRTNIEKKDGQIIIATKGTYSTGVSINKLHFGIFAAAGKSKIETLQSIGRGLRKHPSKDKMILIDIGDNLHSSQKHFNTRIRYYTINKFDHEIKEVLVQNEIKE